jgi:hypothetical protein
VGRGDQVFELGRVHGLYEMRSKSASAVREKERSDDNPTAPEFKPGATL